MITEGLSKGPNKLKELQEKRLQAIESESRTRTPIIGEFQTYEDVSVR